jgi:3-oxoacyl-[acyl-carrier-protein] synthase III
MTIRSVLEIIAYGAWNGGTLTDNSKYENKGMFFKGGIPVNRKTIEERIGIRTRMAAPDDTRIGIIALQDLLETSDIPPERIKVIIGATNVGDDKYDVGPLVRHPFKAIQHLCPNAIPFDLYAGCPGYNVAVEMLFLLSAAGFLKKDDISVIVGAENIHRAKAFTPLDTSNIIFGDDAIATALETKCDRTPQEQPVSHARKKQFIHGDVEIEVAKTILSLTGKDKIDGIIIDNQRGKLYYRVPATAARVQHKLVELMYPEAKDTGVFDNFKTALAFYNRHVDSFAFDIMSLSNNPLLVENIATAYIQAGKFKRLISVHLPLSGEAVITLHQGNGFSFERPDFGIVDTHTKTHGCFANYIQAVPTDNDIFGDMDGKGVFLYATRGALPHLKKLLTENDLSMDKIDLLIEHQANFAMIPMMLDKILATGQSDLKKAVRDYLSQKMITNIHTRGNCSVVCMQRLPYDLHRDALEPDTINGFPINRNVKNLKSAKIILNDSVGAGMTRSSFLQITS